MTDLKTQIFEMLKAQPKQLARELAFALNVPRRNLNQELYSMSGVVQDSDFRWSISNESPMVNDDRSIPSNEFEEDVEIEELQLRDEEIQVDEATSIPKFAYHSLEAVRKRLLDLTGRNALLNYKHPKGSCIRLIDELPNQIYQHLLDGKKFTFIPVPEPTEKELINAGYIKFDERTSKKISSDYPTAEQWAKKLGLTTSYELPQEQSTSDGRHQDSNLQTLFYAPELEVKLRSMRGKSESSIEESGSNILYLALGFLEWYESRESDIARLSPLFTLPVQLERSDLDRTVGAYRYTIQLKDENLISNVTLREKLAQDFDLSLPSIEEDVAPELYFENISNTILRNQPRWKLKRHASLALLNFSKQAMYQDLDPANWPAGSKIDDHPLVSLFFSSQGESEGASSFTYEAEHAIDEIADIHENYPLIYDADSSQHSAIIDVVQGKSLVIEGPPGSGKSQTITNLIAACIANGQSVLFVAEKMAALNVVKNRLDNANLGDFCLELHSHKTNKKKILNDLSTRLNNQSGYVSPTGIDADIERYEILKAKLNAYSLKINSIYANTGSTIHEILQNATRLREQYQINPEQLTIDGLTPQTATKARQNELSDHAHMLGSIFAQVSEQAPDGDIRNHYWHGIEHIHIDSQGIELLIAHLRRWNESLTDLHVAWNSKISEFDVKDFPTTFEAIEDFCKDTRDLPTLLGGEPLGIIDQIYERQPAIEIWLKNYEVLHGIIAVLQTQLLETAIFGEDTTSAINEISLKLKSFGLHTKYSLADLEQDDTQVTALKTIAAAIEDQLSLIVPHVPHELASLFNKSEASFKELATFIELIGQLPTASWRYRDEIYDNDELDGLISTLATSLARITPIYTRLKDDVLLEALPSTQTLRGYNSILVNGGLFKWLSSEWRSTRKQVLALSKLPKANAKDFLSKLPDIIEFSEEEQLLLNLNRESPILGVEFQGVHTPIDRIIELRNWYKAIRREYGVGFGERVKIGSYILSMGKDFAVALLEESGKGLTSNVNALLKELSAIQSRLPNLKLSKNTSLVLTGENGEISELSTNLTLLKEKASKIFKIDSITLTDMDSLVLRLDGLLRDTIKWESSEFVDLIRPYQQSLEIRNSVYAATNVELVRNTLAISQVLNHNALLARALINDSSPSRYLMIRSSGEFLQQLLDEEDECFGEFELSGKLNVDDWISTSDGRIESVQAKNNDALNHISWLTTWLDYARLRSRLYEQGFKNFIYVLEASEMKPINLQEITQLVISYQLSRFLLDENPELRNFTGLEQNATRQRFKEYDARILKLIRNKVAYRASRVSPPVGVTSGKVGDYTETYLIKWEMQKSTRHIAVRELMKRSGRAIQKLKPCFMMSPMSVAQYLEPGKFNFDLVVMDEASQIKPEDALGAIARGARIVVVGDPKQLPPTSFFNKAVDNEDEEDIVGLQDSESILESVMPMFKSRRLRWHYRSKHESLIAFSNKHFYDNNLILFPSPFKFSPEFGIKTHFVARGRFIKGRNVEEAQDVIKAVANHLLNHAHESIGIVAMNVEQRDEIEKQLEQFVKDNPSLISAYEANKNSLEPLFIKNLESVQGDERDIIYISMTYGPEQVGGSTMQRFGPINSDVGWRRLNVLFTRSKKRMHIFTSMKSGDIRPLPTSSKGVVSLRAFLEYAETGHLHQTIEHSKAPDSDFEIAVIDCLNKYGYECEPQLGVAGFFLDIAVRDPGKPGRFLMGIECDGATYHSARSARDRDHLRQEILEGLGWNIRRIWSTDWFNHPDAQIQPILAELEKLRTPIVDQPVEEFEEDHFAQSVLTEEQTDLVHQDREISIEDRLWEFDQTIIKPEFPKTPDENRLLRQEMLDVLLEMLPTSMAEFREKVPAYIRTGTATYEAKFLEAVLSIIADHS